MNVREQEHDVGDLALRVASKLVDDLKRQHDIFRSVFYGMLSLFLANALLFILFYTLFNVLLMVVATVILLLMFTINKYTSSGTILLSAIPPSTESDVCEGLKEAFEYSMPFKCRGCNVREEKTDKGIYENLSLECVHLMPKATVVINITQKLGEVFSLMPITIKSDPTSCFKVEIVGFLNGILNKIRKEKYIEISIWHELKENVFLALNDALIKLKQAGVDIHSSVIG